MTGWAQVCYPNGASEEDALRKLEYDLFYIKHMSVSLDLLVIFQTVKTVLFAKGGGKWSLLGGGASFCVFIARLMTRQ